MAEITLPTAELILGVTVVSLIVTFRPVMFGAAEVPTTALPAKAPKLIAPFRDASLQTPLRVREVR